MSDIIDVADRRNAKDAVIGTGQVRASAAGGARPFCGGGANRLGRTNVSPCYNEARELLAVSLLESLAAQDWRVAAVRVNLKALSFPCQYILSPAVPLFPINGLHAFKQSHSYSSTD